MEKKVIKRTGPGLKPDPKFGNLMVAKFINCLMLDGKKNTARRVFYEALDIIGKKMPDNEPVEVFQEAINNVKPMVEVKSKRVGGSTYQVPIEVKPARQQTLAFRWILKSTRGRKGAPMAQCLAAEFMDAFNKQGASMTTRQNLHRMAEANKAFSHFS